MNELGVLTGLFDLLDETDEEDWQERALCAQTDPEAFFPEKGGSTREAKRICMGCEVKGQCLDYALDREERFGIWGGMSERERRKLSRPGRIEDRDERNAEILLRLEDGVPAHQIATDLCTNMTAVERVRARNITGHAVLKEAS
jgi:WhiB family redox-sensing transcriptional regulator